ACAVAGVALGAAERAGAGAGACAEDATTQLSPMNAAMMSLFITPKRIPQLSEHRRSGFPAPTRFLTAVNTRDSLDSFTPARPLPRSRSRPRCDYVVISHQSPVTSHQSSVSPGA